MHCGDVYVVGNPLCENSTVWIFGQTLAKHLFGKFELLFLKSNPCQEVTFDCIGSIQFRTENGESIVFALTNLKFGFFKQLAQYLNLVEKDKTMFVSRPS